MEPAQADFAVRASDLLGAGWLKLAIALLGVGVLGFDALLARRGRGDEWPVLRRRLRITVSILAVLAWWNFLTFRHGEYGHPTDMFHYYVGAKYFPELGYTRLYECACVADAESGLRDAVAHRSIRNLHSYRRESAAPLLADPGRCKRHFSPERWEAFKRDVTWFREHVPEAFWKGALADHGYNAPPTFGILGATLASTGPMTTTQFVVLSLIDPLLLLLMWTCAVWAFGWRGACAAMIFWGTNQPAVYLWTGGSYLRQGWLFAGVVGICLLRRKRPAAAGFLLTWAALLRVFPALVLAAIGLQGLGAAWRARTLRPSAELRRVALGCAVAVALLVPLSALTAGGLRAWPAFLANIRLHERTPFSTSVGLASALSFDPATRFARLREEPGFSEETWRDARRATLERRRWIFGALALGYALLLGLAVQRQEAWVAAALGSGAFVIATQTSGYYLCGLAAMGFLALRRPALGAGLCGLAALTWPIAWRWPQPDEGYVAVSVAAVAYVVIATAVLWRDARARTAAPRATPS